MKALWKDRQDLVLENKQLKKDLEETRVELEYERSVRRDHQGHAFLLAKEREKLLQMLAKERYALVVLCSNCSRHKAMLASQTHRASACSLFVMPAANLQE